VRAGTGRAEANSLLSFEAAILQARDRLLNPTPQSIGGTQDVVEQLERLASLKERGVLSEEEFNSAKAHILARPS
jgi:hypothetical protein